MSMIERVANALREELQKIGYGVGTINAGQLSDALARAAIEAMREPTEEMWLADGLVDHMHPTDAWEIMIDAALANQPPKPDVAEGIPGIDNAH